MIDYLYLFVRFDQLDPPKADIDCYRPPGDSIFVLFFVTPGGLENSVGRPEDQPKKQVLSLGRSEQGWSLRGDGRFNRVIRHLNRGLIGA